MPKSLTGANFLQGLSGTAASITQQVGGSPMQSPRLASSGPRQPLKPLVHSRTVLQETMREARASHHAWTLCKWLHSMNSLIAGPVPHQCMPAMSHNLVTSAAARLKCISSSHQTLHAPDMPVGEFLARPNLLAVLRRW